MKTPYTVLIEWSEEDACFVGSAWPLVGQCCHGDTIENVAGQLSGIIEDLLQTPDWMANVPDDSDKEYSGRITLRVSPEEHRLLAAKSAARGISINRYAREKTLA